jgi:hypothetical protein
MNSPWTPGAGITGAGLSLGGDRSKLSVASAGLLINDDRTLWATLVERDLGKGLARMPATDGAP